MAEIRYTKDHEYIRIDGAEGVVGISDHAQQQLGDVVFAEVPPLGSKLKAGEPAAVVESVKAASDVFAPVAGEVVAVNSEVEKSPGLINEDPLGRGWLFRIRIADPGEIDGPDGRGRLRRLPRDAGLIDALSAARRRRTRGDAGSDRRPRCRRAVRRHSRRQADRGPHRSAAGQERDGGRTDDVRHGRPQPCGGLGAVLPRRGRLQAAYSRERRSSDPALGVSDQLHALPARDRPGHAEGAVRIPDPGRDADRHGGRQRVHVRRLHRLRRGDADGATADEAGKGGCCRAACIRNTPTLRRRSRILPARRSCGCRRIPLRARISLRRSTARRVASSSRARTSSAIRAISRAIAAAAHARGALLDRRLHRPGLARRPALAG